MTAGDSGIKWRGGSAGPTLIVGPASAVLRQQLGPVAWSALETLALAARPACGGPLTATLNTRQVATAIGVGREAAGNALALLRRRGLIVLEQPRRNDGHFTGTRYTIRIEPPSKPELPRHQTERHDRSEPAPTLFDATSPDLDDAAPDVPRVHVTRDAHATRDSEVVAQGVPDISHTLALSMPSNIASGSARC